MLVLWDWLRLCGRLLGDTVGAQDCCKAPDTINFGAFWTCRSAIWCQNCKSTILCCWKLVCWCVSLILVTLCKLWKEKKAVATKQGSLWLLLIILIACHNLESFFCPQDRKIVKCYARSVIVHVWPLLIDFVVMLLYTRYCSQSWVCEQF